MPEYDIENITVIELCEALIGGLLEFECIWNEYVAKIEKLHHD